MTRIRKDVVIVGIHILLNNAQHMERNVSNVRKKKSFSKFCRSSGGTQKTGIPKHFSRKDVHQVENSASTNFEYDTDSVEFICIHFTTSVFESSQGSQNSQNIMFDKISTLCCALTDLHLENKARVSSKIRFKMDTGASGNFCLYLLTLNYSQIIL